MAKTKILFTHLMEGIGLAVELEAIECFITDFAARSDYLILNLKFTLVSR